MHNVFSHPYQIDESISNFRVVGCYFFNFIQILIEHSANKQWTPWSDAVFCGVWSESILFAHVPQKDARLIWVKIKIIHILV